ncbi:hypothetical protein SAMN05660209_04646 [Geodermatophilus africanus]|uniref:TPM domain-containing protein n=1 Tax=Geodermatophilus africanus TaxID=1137993 RepID=A0A1H3Q7W1_9ACTN|nr:TPM domain-containing protein [Geodermatophilus africanus]SDZ09343.1 hypothetical protein SAMN05660209_04646 [Geodermatophilus africanus]
MRRALIVTGAVAVALSTAGPAWAEPPLEVFEPVTDRAAVLGDGGVAAREATESLAAETDIGLYTVFVPSFDDMAADDWASQTAELSGLEASDVLFAVAVGEGGSTYEYSWWIDDSSSLSEVDVDAVMTGEVEPRLGSNDWSGAVVALAEQLRSSVGPADAAAPGWSTTTTVLVVAAVAVVLLVGHLLGRRKSAAHPGAR